MDPDAAETARQMFRRTQRVVDALPRAIALTDLDGVVVGWNAAAERTFGRPAADAIGRQFIDCVDLVEGEGLAEAVVATTRSGEIWQGEYVVRRPDGHRARIDSHIAPLVDDDGRVVGAATSSEDITDRRLLEQQTRALNDHLRLALAAGELGTWHWDLPSGLTVWDEQMEALFGLPPGGFDGTFEAWVALLHPEDRDDVLATVEAAMADRSGYQLDHRVVHPDGTVRWLHGRGTVVLDGDGNPAGTIGCSTDITVRKRLEIVNRERAEQADHAAERERLERERLQFLAALSDAALDATGHRALMEDVVRLAVPHLGDWCTVHYLPEGATVPETAVAHVDPARVAWAQTLSEEYPFDPDASRGVPEVIRTGRLQFVPEFDDAQLRAAVAEARVDDPEATLELVRALNLTSQIIVPLRARRGVVGAMQFVSAESGRRYRADDVTLALAAAGRVGESLDAHWLAEQHREIATTLQGALLPPRLPEIPGADLAVRYWATGAASDVGGDFYDIFPIDEGRWGLVIGDICGKGPDAAALLGLARHTIRAAAKHDVTPEGVLDWLNDALLASNRDTFATVDFCVLGRQDGLWHLDAVCGGHPLPVLVHADGGSETIGRPGRLLGLHPGVRVARTTTVLEPGATLVLYTDGITDVHPPFGLDADEARLLIAESVKPAESADEALDILGGAVATRLGFEERRDDIALVALRIL